MPAEVPPLSLKCNDPAIYSLHRVQLSWDNPLQHFVFKRTLLSTWKVIASHRYVGAKGWIDMAPVHSALSSSSSVTRLCTPLHNSHHRLAHVSMALLLAVLTAKTVGCCKAGEKEHHVFISSAQCGRDQMLLPTQLAQPAPSRGSPFSYAKLCQPLDIGCC